MYIIPAIKHTCPIHVTHCVYICSYDKIFHFTHLLCCCCCCCCCRPLFCKICRQNKCQLSPKQRMLSMRSVTLTVLYLGIWLHAVRRKCSRVSEDISPVIIRVDIHPDILEEPATSIITWDTYPFRSSKMSVHFYQNTRCHIPENGSLHIR